MRKGLNSTPASGSPVTRRHVTKALKGPHNGIPDDTSGGANSPTVNSLLAMLRAAGLLNHVQDGDGSSVAAWTPSFGTISSVGGRIRITSDGSGVPGSYQLLSGIIPGQTYELSLAAYPSASSTPVLLVGTTAGGYDIINTNPITLDGGYKTTFVAPGSSVYVYLSSASSTAGTYAEFDNVVVVPAH